MGVGKKTLVVLVGLGIVATACKKDKETEGESCTSDQSLDDSRGVCTETLSWQNAFSESQQGNFRVINVNSIPVHKVGKFGQGTGSLNPNAISEQSESYSISINPSEASQFTPLLLTTGSTVGPQYSFGILLNGVELDPVAAEPFPHTSRTDPNVNWEWNLEALNVNLGLDCNNAHVQPNGKYHYHGKPTRFLTRLGISDSKMNLIGYAADGFPIYYKYAFDNATDSTSAVETMKSSYQLKQGNRSGDGLTAPCGAFDGIYSNDYEFVDGLGDLDEANGRSGVTPEFPNGTYYYVLTDEFPSIPRMFRGSPSIDFKIGP